MSEAADRERDARRRWAVPGSSHDRLVKTLRIVLPAAIGVLFAFMAIAPLTIASDMSFVLDKNKVQVAKERLRVTDALYRGQDSKGQPFSLHAGSAVQATSREPIVRMQDLSARLLMQSGPAVLRANQARYNMDTESVKVDGPVLFETADGYRLSTRDVTVDMKTRHVESDGAVEGKMPLGTFSGGKLEADLTNRIVRLEDGARLRIVQSRAK